MSGKLRRSVELATIPFFMSEIWRSSIVADLAWGQSPSRDFEGKRADFEGKCSISELRLSCGTVRSIDPSGINHKSRLEVFPMVSGDLRAFSGKMFFYFCLLKQASSNLSPTWWNDLISDLQIDLQKSEIWTNITVNNTYLMNASCGIVRVTCPLQKSLRIIVYSSYKTSLKRF